MRRTDARVGAPGRFSGAPVEREGIDPAWRPWLRLLELALDAADPAWEAAVPAAPAGDGTSAPLLHGSTLRVDARRLRRLVRTLLRIAVEGALEGDDERAAASLARLRSRRLDVLELVRASIAGDVSAIERIAAATEVEADALAVVAQLGAVPLLQACARRWKDRVSPTRLEGWCPICGAWPTLAELRGLEKNRRLRCGRCAADWPLPVLHCAFCGELHHDNLRSLLPEGEEQTRRVDVCESCKGYLKTVSTLQPLSPRDIALRDLASIDLDLMARERGYSRPPRPARPPAVTFERATVVTAADARAVVAPRIAPLAPGPTPEATP